MTHLIAAGADDVVLEIRYQDGPDLRPRPVYDAGFDPDAAYDAMQVERLEDELDAEAEAIAQEEFAACRDAIHPRYHAAVLATFRRLAERDLTNPVDRSGREGGSDGHPF